MISTRKYFLLFLFLTILLGVSIFFSSRRIKEGGTQVIVVDSHPRPPGVPGIPGPSQGSGVIGKPVVSGSLTIPNCHEQEEYLKLHRELGVLVNKTFLKREAPLEYLKGIEDFRSKSGLPLPIGLPFRHPRAKDVVYNNCKSICQGAVNQVFATRIVSNRFVEVLLKDGTLKQLLLHESGLEIATIDEISAKGVPFRSWQAPMSDGPWFIEGNILYYKLDIEGYALAITSGKTFWSVVPTPHSAVELKSVEPLSINGCSRDEQCLVMEGPPRKRVFKAPNVCSPVVSHAADEEAPPKPTPSI